MKTDEIKQRYITRLTYERRYGEDKNWVYLLDDKEQERFEQMKQFELAGFTPSELTELSKIHLKNAFDGIKQDYEGLIWKRSVMHYVLEIFPDFYEIRFLSKGVYIR